MYKVTVNTSGKYHNVELGARYCFTRKTAIELANLFLDSGCDVTIEKFIHTPSAFMWSNAWVSTRIVFEKGDGENLIARKGDF